MSRRILRSRTEICQLCDFLLPRQLPRKRPIRPQNVLLNSPRTFTTARRIYAQDARTRNPKFASEGSTAPDLNPARKQIPIQRFDADLEKQLKHARDVCDHLLSLDRAPSEQDTLYALGYCNSVAELLVVDPAPPSTVTKSGATSALLSLDESSSAKVMAHKLSADIKRIGDELSQIAYSVVKHPSIFITPQALNVYTTIQASLGKPETLPEVFYLYANKPLPQENTSPIRYSKQNPNKVANAVDVAVAARALQAAIDTKQLVVAMDIIDSTYTTKAFHNIKFLRKCLIPATGVALAPVAAYTIASQLAVLQTTMDSAMATNVAFAGILAYTFFTGTIGVVAFTTANDHMDRVTWAQGLPLRERWIREEERSAIDKIAVSWGFHESWRRGEEEGEDWEALREFIGARGMILDRVELMEGME